MPAIIAREVVIRLDVIRSRAWTHFFVVCFVLAFSAFYELIEWWVAVASGDDAVAFLGTQGYVWNTQSDMFLALIGGLVAVTLFAPGTTASWRVSPGRRTGKVLAPFSIWRITVMCDW